MAALRRRVELESANAGDGTMARPAVAEIVGTQKSPPETLGGVNPTNKQNTGIKFGATSERDIANNPLIKKEEG